MTPQTSTVLRVDNVSKTFGDVTVLRGVSLQVTPGRVHALVGHNGAGKTTLVEILAGLYPDYDGAIHLGGRAIQMSSPQVSSTAGIAVIHQQISLVPEFTAAQNIALGREPRRGPGLIDRARVRTDAEALLARLGLHVPLDVPAGQLSVAQRQFTEIAKALATGARVLVMDEPTSRLGPSDRRVLFGILTELTQQGVGVLFISHHLDEVLTHCDEVTVLRDGVVVHSGAVADLTVTLLTEQITGLPPNAARSPITRHGTRHGTRQGSLERSALVLDDFGPRGVPGSRLRLQAGEIVGIAGLVGSGRTSLLEALAGVRPWHGRLVVGDRPRSASDSGGFTTPGQAVAHGVVLVPQDRTRDGLVPWLSLSENVTLSALSSRFARLGIVRGLAVREAARRSVERYRITSRSLDVPVRELSGGNQQKVLLARATQTGPTVLLCDQPTAGVDIGAKVEIYAHLRELTRAGVAVLLVSDEFVELLTLCDRIAVISDGRLGQAVPAAEFTESSLLAAMSARAPVEVA